MLHGGEIGQCAAVGGYYSGTLTSSSGQQASVLFWKSDTSGDGKIQPNEVELIEYDSTEKIFTSPGDRRTEDYVTGRFG